MIYPFVYFDSYDRIEGLKIFIYHHQPGRIFWLWLSLLLFFHSFSFCSISMLSFVVYNNTQCINCCLASYVSFGGIFKRLKFLCPFTLYFQAFTVLLCMFVQYSLLATVVLVMFFSPSSTFWSSSVFRAPKMNTIIQ